jgi:hypothetical protein
MHAAETLRDIYKEHRCCVPRMVGTLIDLDVPAEDALLLGKLPWEFPANRIAVERERLGMSPVRPLFRFEVPTPPPAWLTPAVIVKMFQLALDGPGDPPPDVTSEDHEDKKSTDETLVLPA